MELSHVGANRKEVKTTAFSQKSPDVSLDAKTGNLILSVRYADGMGTKGQYDYKIVLTPADLTKLLKAISLDRTTFKEGPLRTELESSASALLRLVSAASVLPFQVLPSDLELIIQKAKLKPKPKLKGA